jgi:hypothetical protein
MIKNLGFETKLCSQLLALSYDTFVTVGKLMNSLSLSLLI